MPGNDSGISPLLFWIGAIGLFLAIATIIWFAIPGPDARHRFVSPTGDNVLEIGELCAETGCRRVAVREFTAAGSRIRRGCAFGITEQRPMLLNAYPLWSPDEKTVEIVYADAEGVGGKLALDLERDCTLTE